MLEAGTRKTVYIDRKAIVAGDRPPITVTYGMRVCKVWGVRIHGESELVYRPRHEHKTLKLWIETDAAMTVETERPDD